MDVKLLRIGELAKRSGKTVRALRYYEELELLRPCRRTRGGFRLYTPRELRRIEVISQLQELGLTLDQIAEIVRAWQGLPRGVVGAERLRALLQQAHEGAHKKIDLLRGLAAEFETALRFLDVRDGRGQFPAFIDKLANG